MRSYELNPLTNKDVPKQIADILDDVKNYVIVKDGHIIKQQLSDAFKQLTIKTYDEALPDHINAFLDTEYVNDNQDEAYDYNIDNVNSGLLIHVPRSKYFEEVLHVFYVQETVELVQNTRIVLEPNSELKYFEYLANTTDTYYSFVSNVILKENAKIQYSGLSKLTEKSVSTIIRNAHVFRYGNATYNVAEVNDGITTSNTHIYLKEKYAAGNTSTIAITNKHQEASYKQLVEHLAPETEGFIDNYGVSNNESALVFEGVGKIHKGMKRSVARQSNRGIILGRDARLDANPLLLIDEFDVEASHGAAIGKIDEEQLYYLMSRGLSVKVAERLIINGFLSPVLNVLTSDNLKKDFLESVENKTI